MNICAVCGAGKGSGPCPNRGCPTNTPDAAHITKVTRFLPRCFACDTDEDTLRRPPMMKSDAEAWMAGHNLLHHTSPSSPTLGGEA